MTKLMEEEPTSTWTATNTSVTGKTTSSTATVSKIGQITLNMKVHMNSVRNTELAHSNGPITLYTLVNFIITIFMVKEFTPG